MQKTEKLLNDLSKLQPGSAPSAGYFEKIILEAREALEEFQAFKTKEKRVSRF